MGSQQLALSRKVIRMSGYDFRDASEHGHLKIVEELMAAGCKLDPLVFDSYYLPIHLAVSKGHNEIAKKLINAGCKIDELIYAGACCGCMLLAIMKENMEI